MSKEAFQIQRGDIVEGEVFPEPIRVVLVQPVGAAWKVEGVGLRTGRYHERLLNPEQVHSLKVIPAEATFDGDALRFRLGIEAARLGLAYEYDPYFSLSIARVDPLPHQLEAVYHHIPPLARIRPVAADLWERGARMEPCGKVVLCEVERGKA